MKKVVFGSCLLLASCSPAHPPAQPDVHYTVGPAWQAQGQWYYPREEFAWQGTGLAIRQNRAEGALTADGEVRSMATMTASHPTLQLPAIVTVINLENGRQVRVRVNDRGPEQMGRAIALSTQAANLLGMGSEPAQVRIVEDEVASRHLAEILPGGVALQINAAPKEQVVQSSLGGSGGVVVETGRGGVDIPPASGGPIPDMPVAYAQGYATPGMLWVETMDFTSRYAAMVQAGSHGGVVKPIMFGQSMMWAVRQGPFATISAADAALKRALDNGFNGSHIVVE
ncbi:septal ring lytic transglycosylase RlpA family protein [Acetobacter syzygii]|uniref:septal ring lytic transglycosylase RlpA family protein n=1 Tax=Acetobacter syzygii TaxID=146476 RepID=UPI0039EBA3DE